MSRVRNDGRRRVDATDLDLNEPMLISCSRLMGHNHNNNYNRLCFALLVSRLSFLVSIFLFLCVNILFTLEFTPLWCACFSIEAL